MKKRLLLGVFGIIVLCLGVFVFANRECQSVPIMDEETKLEESNIIGVYIESEDGYTKTDTIPESGYTLNEEQSYCKVGDSNIDATINYNVNTKTLSVSPITTKGTKCYLYFDEDQTLLKDAILANATTQTTRTDFSTTVEETTTGTIYYADTSKGRTYYFAGNPTDNWVQFAGFYWRIIRINEDGSIRLIYNGTGTGTTGTSTQIQTSSFNNTANNNMYVGYMYQSGQVHGLTTDSTIKGVLDTWYQNNLQSYADKISTEAGFCGDRQPSTSSSTSNGSGGTGTITTYYGAFIRLRVNSVPTFECQNDSDLYTAVSSSQGNKALDYPIGLITADEVAFAGGTYTTVNRSYYLYSNQIYWTMSPCTYSNNNALVFYVALAGSLSYTNPTNAYGIRPVINLKVDVTIKSGNGTSTSPYEI